MHKSLLLSLLLSVFACTSPSVIRENEVLWYDAPPQEWLEALPIGNSNLGAMVYGGVDREVLMLNEETFWSGSPYNNDSPRSLERLEKVRQLIFGGRQDETIGIVDEYFLTGRNGMLFLPAGLWVGKDSKIPNFDGYRLDVFNALKELKVPVMRWSGGSFADDYHWMDGIGPQEKRARIANSNWGGTMEDNSQTVTVDWGSFKPGADVNGVILNAGDIHDYNDFGKEANVVTKEYKSIRKNSKAIVVELPAASIVTLEIK